MAAAVRPLIQPDFLVILDIETTCDDLNDPRHPEIVEFPWLVYHVASRSVLDTKQIFIAPRWNANPNPPPDAVRGLGTDVAFAPSLAEALLQFDTYIYHSFILTAKSFVLVTDGHWDITHVLLTEAARKAVALAPHFRTYIDLRAEFSRCYPVAPVPADRKTMFSYLNISIEPRASGVEECLALSNLVTRLLSDGHVFDQPLFISDYEWTTLPAHIPAVATPVATAVAVGGIVRLRGLPWTCTEADVADFLAGIPVVQNGIHFVRNAQGKATGEAFVQLESADAVSLALGRHKQIVGRRYIEVFKSSPVDMANHLGRAEARRHMHASNKRKSSTSSFGQRRSGRQPNATSSTGVSYVVKVSGLASGTRADDLLPLLHNLQVAGNGIHIVLTKQGECSGDAFVQLISEAWAKKAIARSGNAVDTRDAAGRAVQVNVEVRASSAAEARAAMSGGLGDRDSGNGIGAGNGTALGTGSGSATSSDKFYARVRNVRDDSEMEVMRAVFERFGVGEEDVEMEGGQGGARSARVGFRSREEREAAIRACKARAQGLIFAEDGKWRRGGGRSENGSEGGGGLVVKMRGLPYAATEEDIVQFFGGFRLADGGVCRGRDRHGRASGEAWVRFVDGDEARRAVETLDKAHMGTRYIELKVDL